MGRRPLWVKLTSGSNSRRTRARGLRVRALAVKSFGRLGLAASRFLSDLGDIAGAGGQADKAAFVRPARQEPICALCRGNGLVYGASAAGIALANGRAFLPGCDWPLDKVRDVGAVVGLGLF
jgi:hypothetical protein